MSFSNEQPLMAQQTIWAAASLKQVVEEALLDPRFTGMARYLNNIEIFWSRQIETACAGHGFIFFNPDFFDSIPEETRKSVIAHEVWHLILKHLERGKECDPYDHNLAADHVINNGLEDDGFTFDGTDPCKDPQYKGQSTEQVYNTIHQKTDKTKPPKIPDGYVSAEQIEDMIENVLQQQGNGVTLDQQKEKAEKDVDANAEMAGNASGSIGIQLDVSNAKVMIKDASYHDIFKDYLTDPLSGGKRTFMRPNRRQHAMKGPLRLPGRFPKRGHVNRLTHLTYALDVSGSISKEQATQFHQSVKTIKELLNPEKLTVLFFDTKIVLEKTFTDKERYTKIKVNAGGGTDLRDVYKRTAELGSDALVVFTDLCVNIPNQPDWDVIWIVPDSTNSIPSDIYGPVYLIPNHKE